MHILATHAKIISQTKLYNSLKKGYRSISFNRERTEFCIVFSICGNVQKELLLSERIDLLSNFVMRDAVKSFKKEISSNWTGKS